MGEIVRFIHFLYKRIVLKLNMIVFNTSLKSQPSLTLIIQLLNERVDVWEILKHLKNNNFIQSFGIIFNSIGVNFYLKENMSSYSIIVAQS